jgi:hypothetical protein
MSKTQLSAILVAFISFVGTILSNFGWFNITPEMVNNLNAFLLPLIFFFVGEKQDKIEAKSTDAANTARRVEAAQPESAK